MPGDNLDQLGAELWALWRGDTLPSMLFLDAQFSNLPITVQPDHGGSCNWAPVACAARLLYYHRSHDAAGYQAARNLWLGYYAHSRRYWMGKEVGSRIYAPFVLIASLVVRMIATEREDEELRIMAWAWLSFASAWLVAVTNSHGDPFWLGQRSAGHPPRIIWLTAYAAYAAGKQPKKLPKDEWQDFILPELSGWIPVVQDSVSALAALRSFNFRTIGEFYRYESEGGIAVWTPQNRNGNTQPVLLGVDSVLSGVAYFPPNCGSPDEGKNRRKGSMSVEKVEGRFVCRSEVYGAGEVALPPGMVIRFVRWGGEDGYQDMLERPGAPAPAPPTAPPAPKPPKKRGGGLHKLWGIYPAFTWPQR